MADERVRLEDLVAENRRDGGLDRATVDEWKAAGAEKANALEVEVRRTLTRDEVEPFLPDDVRADLKSAIGEGDATVDAGG
jgi:trimethylamine:corrinoid methyltransferase-like protein